jgi:hypothetical protein
MGANWFEQRQDGYEDNVEAAFSAARESAAWEHGHGGYTGTLAEKHEYVVIQPNPLPQDRADALVERLQQGFDDRVDDKWGPAGAIRTETGWVFCGWASS